LSSVADAARRRSQRTYRHQRHDEQVPPSQPRWLVHFSIESASAHPGLSQRREPQEQTAEDEEILMAKIRCPLVTQGRTQHLNPKRHGLPGSGFVVKSWLGHELARNGYSPKGQAPILAYDRYAASDTCDSITLSYKVKAVTGLVAIIHVNFDVECPVCGRRNAGLNRIVASYEVQPRSPRVPQLVRPHPVWTPASQRLKFFKTVSYEAPVVAFAGPNSPWW
jgi:hypothetical protein